MLVNESSFANRIAVLLVCCGLGARAGGFAGGAGEPNDPYQIATAEQLASIGSDPNLLDKHFVLINDIDLDPNLPGGRVFERAVIAPRTGDSSFYAWEGVAFTGTFDGRGYIIKNLMFEKGTADFRGLFGNVGRGALVTDLGIENVDLSQQNGWFQGALAAWNEGRVVRCHATGKVSGAYAQEVGMLVGFNRGEIIACWAGGDVSGFGTIGGLVGSNSYGTIVNSHAASKVLTTGYGIDMWPGGGLVGCNTAGEIVNCSATGDVFSMRGNCLGGLVGRADSYGIIANSYATGNVSVETGGRCLGGLVGSAGGSISDCYATGSVSSGDHGSSLGGLVGYAHGFIADSYASGRVSGVKESEDLGGLVGYSQDGVEINGCFWDVATSGLSQSAGGTGLTTGQMQEIGAFLAAGWDWAGESPNGTADSWFIREGGGYPVLTVHSETFQPHGQDGSGTADDPYRIVTAEDLGAINHYDLTACYRLEAAIDLGGSTWKKPPVRFFDGRFDGAGKAVTGLRVRGGSHLGLFGDLGRSALIADLGVHDANVTGGGFVGMLAGKNRGRIMTCYADGSVVGESSIGNLTGWNEGSIGDSYGAGDVTAHYAQGVGGLAGWNPGTISRCYAAVCVLWSEPYLEDDPGGLVGLNQEDSISGVSFVTGAQDESGEIHECYFLIDSDSGGPDNGLGVPLLDAQMKQQASFVDWNFEDTWMICEGRDYPHLRWEGAECEW